VALDPRTIFAFAIMAIAAALLATERGGSRVIFSASAIATLAAAISLATGDIERATTIAAIITVALTGASMVKFHHSARTLIAADIPLAFAGTVPFFFAQYRRMMLALSAGIVALSATAIGVIASTGGDRLAVIDRASLLVICLTSGALALHFNGGATALQKFIVQPHSYISTFAASVLDIGAWWPTNKLTLVAPSKIAAPLFPAVPARTPIKPDIILIQHESVFDPRIFGLPVEDDIAAFLTPAQGAHGSLNVEIYGGGSWQSEFSVLTGIASSAFGTDAYYLYKKGVGRFKHSLPLQLASLEYRTMLASSCRRGFLNYDAFYGAIGMQARIFSDDFIQPFDIATFEQTHTDALFLPAALDAYADSVATAPHVAHFLYALTNANHGPHSSRLALSENADQRRAFAHASLPEAEYAEYYARLAETADAWKIAKEQLSQRFPDRPILVLHYGDHQPVMTRRMEKALGMAADPQRTFRTFFAIESLNFTAQTLSKPDIAIADLSTLLLATAGLPLDEVSATRAHLIESGGASAEARNQLVRTLIDRKLVILDA
jgi:Sulfatase